jgi:hypothetical protein
MTRDFGRHLFGAAAIAFGVISLRWHAVGTWPQLPGLGNAPYRDLVVDAAAAAALVSGVAMQWRRTAQLGAVVLGVLYLVFAAAWIPRIVQAPLIYDRWGNLFEPLSIFAGAAIAYAAWAPAGSEAIRRIGENGRICFGACVISAALEQAFYLRATAELVPRWIPLGQTFWAIATTIAFALAAAAILSDRQALLASRLLTTMLLLFGLLWIPTTFAGPRIPFNWYETIETFAIAAAAWVLAAYLASGVTPRDHGIL